MAGKRVSFASFADAPVEKRPGVAAAQPPRSAPLHQIAHNPANPRESLGDVSELAASLLTRGQLQPIAVMTRIAFCAANPAMADRVDPHAVYVVVEGNRRLAAAGEAGLSELKIDVNDAVGGTPEEILEAALIANVHRQDFTPMEEARAIQQLLAHYGPRSQAKVARQLNKSEGWVSQRLVLLGLKPELQEQVDSRVLPVKEARRIGRLPAQEQAAQAAAARQKAAEAKERARRPEPEPAREPQPKAAAATAEQNADLYPVKVPDQDAVPAQPPAPGTARTVDTPASPSPAGGSEVVIRLRPGAPVEENAAVLRDALPADEWHAVIELLLDQLPSV